LSGQAKRGMAMEKASGSAAATLDAFSRILPEQLGVSTALHEADCAFMRQRAILQRNPYTTSASGHNAFPQNFSYGKAQSRSTFAATGANPYPASKGGGGGRGGGRSGGGAGRGGSGAGGGGGGGGGPKGGGYVGGGGYQGAGGGGGGATPAHNMTPAAAAAERAAREQQRVDAQQAQTARGDDPSSGEVCKNCRRSSRPFLHQQPGSRVPSRLAAGSLTDGSVVEGRGAEWARFRGGRDDSTGRHGRFCLGPA